MRRTDKHYGDSKGTLKRYFKDTLKSFIRSEIGTSLVIQWLRL